MFRQFGSAIDKIVDRIEVSQTDDSDEYIQFEKTASNGGSEFLSPLLEAIKKRIWVNFEYASFVSGELKPRKVIPLLLKQYSNRWYLISFDDSKQDYITYALDRIEDLDLTSESTTLPLDFNADNYFKHSIGITAGNSSPNDVRIKATTIAAKYLDSLPLHGSQKVIEMGDDEVIFGLRVSISEELIRTILSYGGELIVISPKELKDEVKKRAKKLLS